MAVSNFDYENILDEIKTLLVAKLNTEITSINTLKNDGITVDSVNNNAYFFQTLDESVANFDPFVLYGVGDTELESTYGIIKEKIPIEIIIIKADNGRNEINRILFRYQKALKNIFKKEFLGKFGNKYIITSVIPVTYTALDSSATYKAIGITIETSFTT